MPYCTRFYYSMKVKLYMKLGNTVLEEDSLGSPAKEDKV